MVVKSLKSYFSNPNHKKPATLMMLYLKHYTNLLHRTATFSCLLQQVATWFYLFFITTLSLSFLHLSLRPSLLSLSFSSLSLISLLRPLTLYRLSLLSPLFERVLVVGLVGFNLVVGCCNGGGSLIGMWWLDQWVMPQVVGCILVWWSWQWVVQTPHFTTCI